MDKEQMCKIINDNLLSVEEKINMLYGEYYDACFTVAYYKEKVVFLERSLAMLKSQKEREMDFQCNVLNCEYNNNGNCNYCGDYWTLNDINCSSFIDKNEGLEEEVRI